MVPDPPSARENAAPVVGLRVAALEATGAAVATAILYLATLAGNHSETEDTIPFAVRLRDNPHSDAPHLIYDLLFLFPWAGIVAGIAAVVLFVLFLLGIGRGVTKNRPA
jgi:hypothetical protein